MNQLVSETGILLAYGGVHFASKMGQLAGNHFITLTSGLDRLPELGKTVLWKGAQKVRFEAGLSHMTNFSSLSGSSLRTQGPITPGRKSEERPLLQCRNESPRRIGPCVRRDDSLIRHAYENPYAIPVRFEGV